MVRIHIDSSLRLAEIFLCLSLLQIWIDNNQYFNGGTVISDKATFPNTGTVSSQHVRYRGNQNSNFRIASNRQYVVKVNEC